MNTDRDNAYWDNSFIHDLRYGFRFLRKNWLYGLSIVVVIAASSGFTGAAYTIFHNVLAKDLPYHHPEQLFSINRLSEYGKEPVQEQVFDSLQMNRELISNITAFRGSLTPVKINDIDIATATSGVRGDYFGILGTVPEHGRYLQKDETDQVAVISYNFWHRNFASDPDVIGKSLLIGLIQATIVGIANPDLIGMEPQSDWDIVVPWNVYLDAKGWEPSPRYLMEVIVRLKPQVVATEYEAQINTIWSAFLKSTMPPDQTLESWQKILGEKIYVSSVRRGMSFLFDFPPVVISIKTVLYLSFGILFIGCLTVCFLTVSRSMKNMHDTAIMHALGITRLRICRPYLIENSILLALGFGVGLLATYWWHKLGISFLPMGPRMVWRININFEVISLIFLTTLIIGVLNSFIIIVFSFNKSRLPTTHSFAQAPKSHTRARTGILFLQVVISVFIIYFTIGFVQSNKNLLNTEVGFSTDNLYYYFLVGKHPEQKVSPQYFPTLTDQINQSPEVDNVSIFAGAAPLSLQRSSSQKIRINDIESTAAVIRVGPEYLHTLKVPFIIGRDFIWSDTNSAIITKTMAQNENISVGDYIYIGEDTVEVIGIVNDIAHDAIRAKLTQNVVFVNHMAHPDKLNFGYGYTLIIRSRPNSPQLSNEIKLTVEQLGEQFIDSIRDQKTIIREATMQERLLATILGITGGILIVLVGFGLFTYCNYILVLRQKEIAIRSALGATQMQIAKVLLRNIMAIIISGAIIGIYLTNMGVKVYSRFIEDIGGINNINLLIALMIVFGISLISLSIPLYRSRNINLMEIINKG